MDKLNKQLRISDAVMQVWQEFLDLIAEIADVPVALIMRLEEPYIKVFLSSHSHGNPYKPGDKEHFQDSGLYCEHVIKTKSKLLVSNALEDPDWDHNPDIKLSMISYLGMPVFKPDGEPFGTICILDNKANTYNPRVEKLMEHYRNMIQRELALEYLNMMLGQENTDLNDVIADLQNKNDTILENEQKLRDLNQELSNKMETLNWLIKVISHDVRGPLGSFRDLLEMLAEGEVPDSEVQNYLELLRNRSTQIYLIVNEMLDSIKMQSSSIEAMQEIKPQNLVPILQGVYELYRPIAAHKNIELIYHHDEECVVAPVDQDLIKIAVRNLLNNAVKFSQAQSKISLSLEPLEPGALIVVKDEGSGISAQALASLEEGVLQTSGAAPDPQKGYGLGLNLAKDCVKRMQGSLDIQSEAGKGTSIIIRIPG